MLSTKQISDVLQEWTELFMNRSARDFKRLMDESGLSPSQINTLMRLYYGGMCGVSDIGGHLRVTNAAASQMIDRMVTMNLLERSEDPDDRRAKRLTLTVKGKALVEKGIDARRAWMEALTTNLSDEQQAMIAEALTVLTKAAKDLGER
jgi:DNA-binding MarR family transcriptional regulator